MNIYAFHGQRNAKPPHIPYLLNLEVVIKNKHLNIFVQNSFVVRIIVDLQRLKQTPGGPGGRGRKLGSWELASAGGVGRTRGTGTEDLAGVRAGRAGDSRAVRQYDKC